MSGLLAATLLVVAASSADPQAAHLAGLARAWGYVKYVHPAMVTSRIDWDAALVRAIPAVESAATDQEYRKAIAGMLAELHDPATRVLGDESADARHRPPAPGPVQIHLEAVEANTAVLSIPNDPALKSTSNLQSEICARFTEAARFERVVLDLRSPRGHRPGWELQSAIVKCASLLLDRDVTLAPARFLTHGFYMMQSVTGGAGGGLGPWESGLKVVSSGSVRGEGSRTPRLAFIVNPGTANLYSLLMALQARGLAYVVQEGDVPAAGVMLSTFEVDHGLSIAVRRGELLRPDGAVGFRPDAVVRAGGGNATRQRAVALLKASPRSAVMPGPVSTPFTYAAFVENDYSDTPYPDRRHRLLALFRLYNAIEYFFPYKDLMDRSWDETLAEFIPRMRGARDAIDYALTVAELATRLQDSHVTVSSPVLDAHFGTHRPAVRSDLAEGQTVVTEVAPEVAGSGLRVGDVLLSVDGEKSAERRCRLARYLSASTPGRLENKVDSRLLLGPPSELAVLEVRDQDGEVRRAVVPRTLEGSAPRARPRTGPAYRLLPEGYGYVDLERLGSADVGPAFELVRRAQGLILDMRGYPSSNAPWMFVPRLARQTRHAALLLGTPHYEGHSGTFSLEEGPALPVEPAPGERYEGRVVTLADGSSQSAAETVCLMIKAATDVTFIGSQTSGANGGVTRTVLPGGIVVNFTGFSVRNLDGAQFQRVGIVPDIEARPTLRGIREGRDDVLERAIQFLSHEK